MEWVLLGSSLLVILGGAELFTNGVEWIGEGFGLSEGVVGSVLAAVGEAIHQTIRASDFAGRNGGEEFLALLPDTTSEGAVTLAEKLRTAIKTTDVAGLGRPVTASFGVATFPVDAVDSESLVRIADRALYLAKHNGRDRVEVVAGEDPLSSDLDVIPPG